MGVVVKLTRTHYNNNERKKNRWKPFLGFAIVRRFFVELGQAFISLYCDGTTYLGLMTFVFVMTSVARVGEIRFCTNNLGRTDRPHKLRNAKASLPEKRVGTAKDRTSLEQKCTRDGSNIFDSSKQNSTDCLLLS